MAKKVLLAVPAYNEVFYDDGTKTGLFVTEALHPFEVFKAAGYDVDFVSETGHYGIDEHSTSPDFLNGDDLIVFNDKNSDFNVGLSNIKKATDVNPSDYEIVFFAAGHAAVLDYPKATTLQSIASEIYKNGGVIAAVCHGPAIFDGLKDLASGALLAQGKTITGFTTNGEEILGVDKILEKYGAGSIEFYAKKIGAKFSSPQGPWDDYSVVDGRIVTGVNPASASSTAKKSITALRL